MQTVTAKTANELQKIVSELTSGNRRKADFIVPASKLSYTDGYFFLQTGSSTTDLAAFLVNDVCHEQIAQKLDIPVKYYRRMRKDNSALLEESINSWLKLSSDSYMVRCIKGENGENSVARALLSDRYNCIDNYDVMAAAMEAIYKMGVKVEVLRAEVTEKRLYLQVSCPEVEQQAEEFLKGYLRDHDALGNGIVSGFVLSNSEVGMGTFSISPRAVIVKCNNGLLMKSDSFKKIHLGGKLAEGEINWSEKTKQKNYELVIAQTQDAIRTFLNKDYLGKMIEKIAETKNIHLTHRIDTVQHVCRELAISDDHLQNILNFYISDGDGSAAGVMNAITRETQNMDADMQFDVENNLVDVILNIKDFDRPFSKN